MDRTQSANYLGYFFDRKINFLCGVEPPHAEADARIAIRAASARL